MEFSGKVVQGSSSGTISLTIEGGPEGGKVEIKMGGSIGSFSGTLAGLTLEDIKGKNPEIKPVVLRPNTSISIGSGAAIKVQLGAYIPKKEEKIKPQPLSNESSTKENKDPISKNRNKSPDC